ncbi:MAG TPA: peptidoglycan-associated lipoprotein Pal [Stenotrophobium sp.]|nr:peptidoglycan-associated lipoprotein Pal [Stenotrophobium sp.]
MNKKYLIALVAAVALAGCASNGTKNGSAGAAGSEGANGMNGNTNGSPTAIGGDAAAAQAAALEQNKIYFAFDSTDINADGENVINTYSKYLLANPTAKVRLEGNTDERGSRSYNMALGERRANAVKSELDAKGVAAGQTTVISYGEERPADPGHNEAAWAKNRRVEIKRQ